MSVPSQNMDYFDQLIRLRQEDLPIEEYIQQFCEISDHVPLDEATFKDIFCHRLNRSLKICFPKGNFPRNLKDYMEYTLILYGSKLTLEDTSQHAASDHSESQHAATDRHEKSQVTIDHRKCSQVTINYRQPSQVTVYHCERSQVTVDHCEYNQVTVNRPVS